MPRRPEDLDQEGVMLTSFTDPSLGRVVVKPNKDYLRMDSSNSTLLGTDLGKILGERITHYVLDFSQVSYISGSSLRELVAFSKNLHRLEDDARIPRDEHKKVTIVPSDRVAEVLMLAGLDTVFDLQESL